MRCPTCRDPRRLGPSAIVRFGAVAGCALLLAACATSPHDPLGQLAEARGWQHSEPQPGTGSPTDPDRATLRGAELVVHALAYLGVPYQLGGTNFDSGFDCSGFVQAAARQSLGVRLPRTASEQAQATLPVDDADPAPGDLVFFNTQGRDFSHVGIYVGAGRFIHSPRSGADIRLEEMTSRYWSRRFNGARRVAAVSDPLPASVSR